jgi:hypothetical protein
MSYVGGSLWEITVHPLADTVSPGQITEIIK